MGREGKENEVDVNRFHFFSPTPIAPTACTFGLAARSNIGLLLYPSKVTELCLKRIIYSYYN